MKPDPAKPVKRTRPQVMFAHTSYQDEPESNVIATFKTRKLASQYCGREIRRVVLLDASPEGLADIKERMARTFAEAIIPSRSFGVYFAWENLPAASRNHWLKLSEAALSLLIPAQPKGGAKGKRRAKR